MCDNDASKGEQDHYANDDADILNYLERCVHFSPFLAAPSRSSGSGSSTVPFCADTTRHIFVA
jgi:hypothetical protein